MITPEQMQALTAAPDSPLRLVDPASRREFVLLRAELFDQVGKPPEEFQTAQTYAAVEQTFAEGWNDPVMDDYDRYEEFRP